MFRFSGSNGEKTPIGELFVAILRGENRYYLLLVSDQQFRREAPFVGYFSLLEYGSHWGECSTHLHCSRGQVSEQLDIIIRGWQGCHGSGGGENLFLHMEEVYTCQDISGDIIREVWRFSNSVGSVN